MEVLTCIAVHVRKSIPKGPMAHGMLVTSQAKYVLFYMVVVPKALLFGPQYSGECYVL